MKYPKLLEKNGLIGVCAPSSGVPEYLWGRLDKAKSNIEALGYQIIETNSVRNNVKCVSNTAEIRAKEFMELYTNDDVKLIFPPWGGEFLIDMLPYIDFEKIKTLELKWLAGYSDITTLSFVLTILCDVATLHGSNLMNMGFEHIYDSDKVMFDVLSKEKTIQYGSEQCGGFTENYASYALDQKTEYKTLNNENISFSGRIIGGCLDVLCKLIGTKYGEINPFLEKYQNDGFIWTIESCDMEAADIYRTLWQMKQCGWFKYCNGVIIGRADNYSDNEDFTLIDALSKIFENIPIVYDADIGHLPPQLQLINGAYAEVKLENKQFSIKQILI